MLVDLTQTASVPVSLGSAPCVVIGVGADGADCTPSGLASTLDVIATGEDDLGMMLAHIGAAPRAAAALAVLLRLTAELDSPLGLAAESAVYSTLQEGPEFHAWRERHSPRPPDHRDTGPVVVVARAGATLHITLDRPWKHNAFNAAMRDGLAEALSVALVDDAVERIQLDGRGPSFCSGGDLDEFGTRPDSATAHVTRLTRSPARLLWHLRDRVEVAVHGSCLGAGVELAAFASRVTARADARFGLPELSLGLVPGSGGTVSLPRRIGRQRTAWLALTALAIEAETALRWGLVDELRSPGS